MSKQSEAKKRMGYVPKLVPNTCSNCAFFSKDIVVEKWEHGSMTWTREKNLRCLKGGFVVKKMGTCNEWRG